MDSKGFGEFWDITILVASLITVIVYVAETELESIGANSSSEKETISMALVWLDFVCTLLFFIDFILQTLASVPMYGKFCGVPYPLYWFGAGKIDLVTVFPFFITMGIFNANQPDLYDSSAPGYVFQKVC